MDEAFEHPTTKQTCHAREVRSQVLDWARIWHMSYVEYGGSVIDTCQIDHVGTKYLRYMVKTSSWQEVSDAPCCWCLDAHLDNMGWWSIHIIFLG